MRILGLDLSKTSTGWALWAPGDKPASGVWELGSPLTSRGIVFGRLHENMMALHRLGAIEAVFYEDLINIIPQKPGPDGKPKGSVIRTNKESILLSAGLCGHVESFGDSLGFRVIHAVHQATWRRDFFGFSKRGIESKDLKQMAMDRARMLGFRPTKHDEAEAIGIMNYGCTYLGITPPWIVPKKGMPAPLGAFGG